MREFLVALLNDDTERDRLKDEEPRDPNPGKDGERDELDQLEPDDLPELILASAGAPFICTRIKILSKYIDTLHIVM